MCQKQNNFINSDKFPDILNRILNVMLKKDIAYKDELIAHLNALSLKCIEKYDDFLAYIFEKDENVAPLDINKFQTRIVVEMYVNSKNHYPTDFLLHVVDNQVRELEIFNAAGENYLELENFDNIKFMS